MRITVMGVLIVIGGVLLLALLVDHMHRTLNEEPKQSGTKVNGDEQSNPS